MFACLFPGSRPPDAGKEEDEGGGTWVGTTGGLVQEGNQSSSANYMLWGGSYVFVLCLEIPMHSFGSDINTRVKLHVRACTRTHTHTHTHTHSDRSLMIMSTLSNTC